MIRKRMFVVSAVMLLGVVAGAVLSAQSSSQSPKYSQVKYSADDSSYKWDGDNKILVLKGNVKFVNGDTVMTSDRVDYDEKSRTATGSGNLKIVSGESTVTGEKCVLSFKEKKASVVGNVVLLTKPKPKADSKKKDGHMELKDEVTVTCASIDYFYKEKKASIPTPVVIVQSTRKVTADSATYFGNEDKVILSGNVKGEDSKDKHTFDAPKVTVSLKDDDQWMQAEKASGTFFIKDEDEESAPGKPSQKPSESAKDKPGK